MTLFRLALNYIFKEIICKDSSCKLERNYLAVCRHSVIPYSMYKQILSALSYFTVRLYYIWNVLLVKADVKTEHGFQMLVVK